MATETVNSPLCVWIYPDLSRHVQLKPSTALSVWIHPDLSRHVQLKPSLPTIDGIVHKHNIQLITSQAHQPCRDQLNQSHARGGRRCPGTLRRLFHPAKRSSRLKPQSALRGCLDISRFIQTVLEYVCMCLAPSFLPSPAVRVTRIRPNQNMSRRCPRATRDS